MDSAHAVLLEEIDEVRLIRVREALELECKRPRGGDCDEAQSGRIIDNV